MKIVQATPLHAPDIAKVVMIAMTDECCQYLAGENHTLDDFEKVMTKLAASPLSQYSYTNTLVAIADDGRMAGACVSYDGGLLKELRQAFLNAMNQQLGRNLSSMTDETEPGELYLDSITVFPQYRRQGMASALIEATWKKAQAMNLPLGLLVDKTNPKAHRLYNALGFKTIGEKLFGGHEMWHLQKKE